jgi:hypothetical protein
MLRKIHLFVRDDPQIVYNDSAQFQPAYNETLQLHIIGVEQHTDVVENHQYSVDKPNETQCSEMTTLWDTRCHPVILGNNLVL